MNFIKFGIAAALCIFAIKAEAQEVYSQEEDEQSIAIFGKACERMRDGEATSSTRVRVIDKASYAAAENMSELQEFKEAHDEYDVNVLIYDLVDNYVEDMVVKTLGQDENGICVELSAFVAKSNFKKAIGNAEIEAQRRAEAQNDDLRSPRVIAEEAFAVKQPQYPKISPPNPVEFLSSDDEKNPGEVRVFFEPTIFYNDTKSNKFTDILKQQFSAKENWKITLSKDRANYVVVPKVLKAKIDPVNKNTNRLQMVVSVELLKNGKKSLITERQNRFVLFTTDEDEQEVAFKLLKKLFQNAGDLIIKRIDRDMEKNS